MRVVITGATGNVGTSVLQKLGDDDAVTSILGLARRRSTWQVPKTSFVTADVATDDLRPYFDGADAVIHLAWLFQPTHRPMVTWQANVEGSIRVFDAVAAAKVPIVIYGSSVGAYSPGKNGPVSEDWPTNSVPMAGYGREKAYVERLLDTFEARHPDTRVVRLRPAFIFKRQSAAEQRRLFLGPLVPKALISRPLISRLPILPLPAGLRFQALHAADVAAAYELALTSDVQGAFNLAAEPIIDGPVLGELMGARVVHVPSALARGFLAAGWHFHAVPADPALFDLALQLPLLDVTRARTILGWEPKRSATEALQEVLEGMAVGAGMPTPPLAPDSVASRVDELATGVGERSGRGGSP